MRKFLLSSLALATALFSGAFAQTPGEALDGALSGKADLGVVNALDAENDAIRGMATNNALDIGNIKARLDAIEAQLADPDPAPDPEPTPEPEPTPDPDPTPDPSPDPSPDPGPNPNPAPAPAGGVPVGYFPYVNDGYALTQFNTNAFYPWYGELPLANWAKYEWKKADLDQFGVSIDALTGWVTSLPAGPVDVINIRPFAKEYPAIGAGDWIIEWEGAGDVDVPGYASTLIAPGKRRVSIPASDTGIAMVTITAAPARLIFVGEEKDYGKLWRDEFVDDASRYKIIRTMNWNGVNGSRQTRAEQTAVFSDAIWGVSPGGIGRDWADDVLHLGVPDEAILRLCVAAESACWINVPASLGGQSVIAELMVAGNGANNAERSASYNALSDAVAANAQQVLTDMRREFRERADMLIDALEASGYPEDRVLYAEPGNENWNYGSVAFKRSWAYADGLGKGLFPGQNNASALGYGVIVAAWADAMNERLHARGRRNQQWLVPMNTKTAGTSGITAKKNLDGAKGYNTQFSSPVPLSKMPLSGTGYYSGAFRFRTPNFLGETVKADYAAAFCASIQSDQVSTGHAIRDWFLDPAPMRDNAATVMAAQDMLADIADQYGTFYLGQYEGGNHDNIDNTVVKACPEMRPFANQWMHGADGGAVQKALIDAMVSNHPYSVISNYIVRADRYDPAKPWFDLLPDESSNGYTQAWESVLRDPISQR